jgi:3-hydroxyisobutyrate dehydrogenase-like beta-hydroxyacid dehydrogenase
MKRMSDRNPVGLIGIGLLGQAFAHRLADAGFEVVGFDVDPAKNAKLGELGGRPASSVADLARRCDPIVLAVFSTDQVEAVIESELLPALGDRSGKIVLCASTCDPDRIAALGKRVAARGLHLLETPVSGASGQVSRGEGVALIGGDAQVASAVEPILRALFAAHFHMGKSEMAGAPSSPSI